MNTKKDGYVLITAQYYENYQANNNDWDGIKEGWKPKGGDIFRLDINTEDFFYTNDKYVVEAIKVLLSRQSNKYVKYEYVSHEVMFSEYVKLDEKEFDSELEKITAKSLR